MTIGDGVSLKQRTNEMLGYTSLTQPTLADPQYGDVSYNSRLYTFAFLPSAETQANDEITEVLIGGAGDDLISGSIDADYMDEYDNIDGVVPIKLNSLSMQFKPQSFSHFQNSREIRHTLTRKRFVQTFTAHARIFSHLRHALRTGNIPQSFSNKSRIAITFFKASIQIQRHFFRRSQMFSYIKFTKTSFHDLSPFQCNLFSELNILDLRRFVARTQHNDHLIATLCVINPIACAKKQSQLADAITHARMVTKIAEFNSRKPCQYPHFYTAVSGIQPCAELATFNDFNHSSIVSIGIQKSSNTINLKPTSMEAIQKIAANDNEWRVVA
jgi:hypothetical protein